MEELPLPEAAQQDIIALFFRHPRFGILRQHKMKLYAILYVFQKQAGALRPLFGGVKAAVVFSLHPISDEPQRNFFRKLIAADIDKIDGAIDDDWEVEYV